MRQVSKIALLLAPVLLAASGCASQPTWMSRKPVAKSEEKTALSRTDRLLGVAQKYERDGKPEVAYRLYEHIIAQDPQQEEARKRMLALKPDSGDELIAKSSPASKTIPEKRPSREMERIEEQKPERAVAAQQEKAAHPLQKPDVVAVASAESATKHAKPASLQDDSDVARPFNASMVEHSNSNVDDRSIAAIDQPASPTNPIAESSFDKLKSDLDALRKSSPDPEVFVATKAEQRKSKTLQQLLAEVDEKPTSEITAFSAEVASTPVPAHQRAEDPSTNFHWAEDPAEKIAQPQGPLVASFPEATPQAAEITSPAEEAIAKPIPQLEIVASDLNHSTSRKPQTIANQSQPQDWWGEVFEQTPQDEPVAEKKQLKLLDLESGEVIAGFKQMDVVEQREAFVATTSETPKDSSLEGIVEAANQQWNATSVQRLCTADASEELILVVALLDSEEPTERIAGLIELGIQGKAARPASQAVRALLKDDDSLVRVHAASTVREIEGNNTEIVQHLTRLLSDSNQDVSRLSAYLLGQMGSEAASAVPALEQIRDSGKSLTSLHAAEALTRISPDDTASYELLTAALNSESREHRLFAAVSLGGVRQAGGKIAAAALKDALKNEDPDVRATAALSLGGLGNDAQVALDELQHASEFDTPDVRDAALTALACLGR